MTAAEYTSAGGALVGESAATQRVDALFDLERWADVVSHAAPLIVDSSWFVCIECTHEADENLQLER